MLTDDWKKKRVRTHYQYEPLVAPESWKDEEKRLVIRLTDTLDVLFDRLGRMDRRILALEKAQEGGAEDE